MGHIDMHYLSKDTVKNHKGKLYILGIIDDYSRICWLKLVNSTKTLDVTFGTMEILSMFKERYDVTFTESEMKPGPMISWVAEWSFSNFKLRTQ